MGFAEWMPGTRWGSLPSINARGEVCKSRPFKMWMCHLTVEVSEFASFAAQVQGPPAVNQCGLQRPCKIGYTICFPWEKRSPPFQALRKQRLRALEPSHTLHSMLHGEQTSRQVTLGTNMSSVMLCVWLPHVSHFILTTITKNLRLRSLAVCSGVSGRLWTQTQICLPPKSKLPNPGCFHLQS